MSPAHPNEAAAEGPLPRIGAYRLVERFAWTSAGTVYRAVDEACDAAVLIKVAHHQVAELRAHPDTLRALVHPGIVPVRDALITDEGEQVLVLDLPRGRSVGDAVHSFEGNYRRIAQFIRDAAVVLDYAHGRGVTHGDVSERTILMGEADEPVFSEFGMGLSQRGEAPARTAGGGGGGVAQPAENLERRFKIDERADLFGLGAVLYFLLSGSRATDEPIALMSDPATREDDITPIDRIAPEAPPELRAICNQALSTDPIHRYLHAATLVRDLDVYLHGKRSRSLVKFGFIVIAALAVGLFGLWGTTGGGPARIVHVEMRVTRSGTTTGQFELLEGAAQAMALEDGFQLHVELSKAGHVSVFYRAPTGMVTRLGSSMESGEGRRVHDLPGPGATAGLWRPPPPGGVGILLIVSHTHDGIRDGPIDGTMATLGEPPRCFSALSWWGRHIQGGPEPYVSTGQNERGLQRRWRTFGDYADQAIKALTAENDDLVVGLLYVVGA